MSLWFGKKKKLSSALLEALEKYIADNFVEEDEEALGDAGIPECGTALLSEEGRAQADEDVSEPEPARFFGTSAAPSKLRNYRKSSKNAMEAVPCFKEESLPPEGMAASAAMRADSFVGAAPAAMAMATPTGKTLEDALKKLDKSFMELVFYFADEKGITDAELQKKANIDRKAFSKLRCGTTKNPSKSTALALALALELTLDDARDLLSRAGFALSPCSRQDLIVQFFIERQVYDIDAVNTALYEHGEQVLGCSQ